MWFEQKTSVNMLDSLKRFRLILDEKYILFNNDFTIHINFHKVLSIQDWRCHLLQHRSNPTFVYYISVNM